MKQTSIFVKQLCYQRGLDVLKVGDIHDESQSDVATKDIQEFANVVHEAARMTTEELNMNLPIEMDVKVGLSWAETH